MGIQGHPEYTKDIFLNITNNYLLKHNLIEVIYYKIVWIYDFTA